MTRAVHCVFVHGVGEQSADFADKATKWLAAACSRNQATLYARSVHWSPLLDAHQRKMMKRVASEGSANRPAQRLTVGTLSDALCYDLHRDAIHHVFDYEVRQLRADDFVIFAHSLGALIAVDWMRSRQRAQVGRFVTFGCNLELFHLGRQDDFVAPAQVAQPGSWHNLFDEDDALGWPIRGWIPHVVDHEVSVGGLLTGWWGLSHTAYLTDKKLWTQTMPRIILGR